MRDVFARRLLIASSLAMPWFFGWLAVGGALRSDYSHATKAVSELGAWGAPYMAAWNGFGFLGTGLLLLGFVWGYRRVVGVDAVGVVALALAALLFCLTAIPIVMGADGDPDFASGWTRAHMVAVLLNPLPWLYATGRMVVRFWSSRWRNLSVLSAVAVLGVVLTIVGSMAQVFPHAPGLLQRVSFLFFLGWYTAVSVVLLKALPKGP